MKYQAVASFARVLERPEVRQHKKRVAITTHGGREGVLREGAEAVHAWQPAPLPEHGGELLVRRLGANAWHERRKVHRLHAQPRQRCRLLLLRLCPLRQRRLHACGGRNGRRWRGRDDGPLRQGALGLQACSGWLRRRRLCANHGHSSAHVVIRRRPHRAASGVGGPVVLRTAPVRAKRGAWRRKQRCGVAGHCSHSRHVRRSAADMRSGEGRRFVAKGASTRLRRAPPAGGTALPPASRPQLIRSMRR